MQLISTMSEFESLRAQERNGTNVTVVKSALQLMGNDCGAVRPPGAWPLASEAQDTLRGLLRAWKVAAQP